VFRQLASLTKFKPPRRPAGALRAAPPPGALLAEVEAAARAGQAARIVAKINALTDAG
jgi:polyphosphate kinase